MSLSERRRTWLDLLLGGVGVLLFVAGANLLTLVQPVLLAISIVLAFGGMGLVLYALARRGSPRRVKAALVLGVTVVGLLGLILPLGMLRFRTQGVQESFDRELGWSAMESPESIGMFKQRPDPARRQVLVVGDSILWGKGVKPAETAPGLLDVRLADRGVQVLNASVSGWSVDQYYVELRRLLGWLKPVHVIIGVYAGNDFEISSRNYGWGHSKPVFKVIHGALVRVNPDLFEDNCVDRLAYSLLFRPIWRDHHTAQMLLDNLCDTTRLDLAETEAMLARLFQEMETMAKASGAGISFLLLPEQRDFLQWKGGGFPYYDVQYSSFHRHLRRLIVDGHHDLLEFMPDIARDGRPFDQLFLDQGHYTPAGHVVLANMLERELVARGVVPAAKP